MSPVGVVAPSSDGLAKAHQLGARRFNIAYVRSHGVQQQLAMQSCQSFGKGHRLWCGELVLWRRDCWFTVVLAEDAGGVPVLIPSRT